MSRMFYSETISMLLEFIKSFQFLFLYDLEKYLSMTGVNIIGSLQKDNVENCWLTK